LREAVKDGQFREDLYYRLNTLVIAVPPLRDRPEDIPLLVDQFVKAANLRTGKHVSGISKEAVAALRGYDWPGNVRELEHVIDRAVAFAREDVIVPDALPAEIFEPRQSTLESLEEMERRHILYVLRKTQGNRNRAAEVFGIDRKTLYRKLLRFGIEGDAGSDDGGDGSASRG
jgi:transcriptional regulator with PAS, ATPase and Fis domain